MAASIANRVAGAFLCAWLAIAYAAADHPLPPAFLFLVVVLLACALFVRLRVPTYLSWYAQQSRGRLTRVMRDGAVGGGALCLLVLVLSSGEPSIQPGIGVRLIGAGVMVALGAANALMAYGCSVTLRLSTGELNSSSLRPKQIQSHTNHTRDDRR
jgi:cobalamin synthase